MIKKIIILILTFSLGILSGIAYCSSKSLEIVIDNNIKVSINEEIYNTDYIKFINNGKIITKKEKIDTTKVGDQVIKIKIKDFFNREKEYSYNLNVYDNTPPSITFKKEHTTNYNKKIDLLKDVKAVDNSNEIIAVSIEGTYNIKKPGTYKLYYVAKDSTGNETKEEFTLRVKKKATKKTTTTTSKTENVKDTTFTTSNGFSGYTKNGLTYINGILIANKTYSLPSTYQPGGITTATKNAFNEMQAAAKLDNINLVIKSGYRSYKTQKNTYNYYVKRDGTKKADTYSARPGHSEHQTGMAIDLNIVNDTFHNTKEAKWLSNNCYKYGFILRYPSGKTNETGYKYESWHFRYVGVDLATKLYNNGNWITLESYFGITSQYS